MFLDNLNIWQNSKTMKENLYFLKAVNEDWRCTVKCHRYFSKSVRLWGPTSLVFLVHWTMFIHGLGPGRSEGVYKANLK